MIRTAATSGPQGRGVLGRACDTMANVKVPRSQGMTEKAKHEFSKKQFLTVEEREKEVIESIPVEHREALQEIVKEFRDVFPE